MLNEDGHPGCPLILLPSKVSPLPGLFVIDANLQDRDYHNAEK